jgi:hypothetical protein
MSEAERTTPAPNGATLAPLALVSFDVQRLMVTDNSGRTTGIYEDPDLRVSTGRIEADGLVLVSLIPTEDVDEVRYARQSGVSVLETLHQARAALDAAIRARESLPLTSW